MIRLFVILSNNSDGCTYSCNDVLDSIWSSEELALKRLYFLEEYHEKEIRSDEYGSFGFEIKEMDIDQVSDVYTERETKWIEK